MRDGVPPILFDANGNNLKPEYWTLDRDADRTVWEVELRYDDESMYFGLFASLEAATSTVVEQIELASEEAHEKHFHETVYLHDGLEIPATLILNEREVKCE